MMKSLVLCFGFLALAIVRGDDEGFLEGSMCNEAQDCYINDGSSLALACYYNVKKCKCYNTVSSIYHLTWDKRTGQCLSSKYGFCGVNGAVKVGCSDGFVCGNNRCVDPNDEAKTVKSAYKFYVSSCSACRFSDELLLQCDWNSPRPSCICEQNFPADKRGNVWEIRNYDGNHNCSASHFGPCGTRNGVTIECHGEGMECVEGTCTNPRKPLSSLNEICQENKNCEQGTICSQNYVCIKPHSSERGVSCNTNEECASGLVCRHNPLLGRWSSNGCYSSEETFGPSPKLSRPSPYD